MRCGFPIVCALVVVLGGCAATPSTPAGAPNEPVGYRYHDNQHPNWVNGASPEAIANAESGTWLWPPSSDIVH
jgi:hypothetical protein